MKAGSWSRHCGAFLAKSQRAKPSRSSDPAAQAKARCCRSPRVSYKRRLVRSWWPDGSWHRESVAVWVCRSTGCERWWASPFNFPNGAFSRLPYGMRWALPGPARMGRRLRPQGRGRALSRVGLDESFADRSPFRLSGGEKRRVALAAAIADRPKLVLLDEPEVGLDLEGSRQVENLIRALKEEGAAVVVATHDVGAALRWADRCLLLQRGRLTAVVETASGFSREGLGRLSPYLWDGGTLNRLQREGEERGVELSDPYKAPDAFLAALRSSWEPLEPSVLPFSSPKAMSPSPPLETDRRR